MTTVQMAEDFLRYCKQYPDQRFWQAIRNYTGFPFVFVKTDLDSDSIDTFYIQNNVRV